MGPDRGAGDETCFKAGRAPFNLPPASRCCIRPTAARPGALRERVFIFATARLLVSENSEPALHAVTEVAAR
jgi:hypothetical protein